MSEDGPEQLSLLPPPPSGSPASVPAPVSHGEGSAAGGSAETRTVVGHGPREVEAAVLAAIAAHGESLARDPAGLARPLRVIVPSRSLRDHLVAAALEHTGRPLVGVSIQTMFATATEILARSGEVLRGGRVLSGVLTRRRARKQAAFARPLAEFEDAFGIVEPTVHDLLDAGARPDQAAALASLLEEAEESGVFAERARAAAITALSVYEELEAEGFAHGSQMLARAAAALRDDAELLPAAAVLVHGFAEATGSVTDVLLTVAVSVPTTLFVDEPLEPGVSGAVSRGAVFAKRLRERFEGLGPTRLLRAADSPADGNSGTAALRAPAEIDVIAAPGCEAEVREVAGRVRALLDAGARPERIGVVARNFATTGYAVPLRTHFDRLGIPYSGVSATLRAAGPARRAAALVELLRRGETCATDRWVAALATLAPLKEQTGVEEDERARLSRGARADLQLALRHIGAARLRDVAGLEPDGHDISLPARRGLSAPESESGAESESDGDDDAVDDERPSDRDVPDGPFARRRRLQASTLEAAVGRARSLARRLEAWPERAAPARHLAELEQLLRDDLGWPRQAWQETGLSGLVDDLPDGFELEREEFRLLVGDRLAKGVEQAPLGGKGGGVAVLSVVEARGRTFDTLFVLGLNRDVFPRPVREDPLLPDSLRRRLAVLLPDLPIKATGHDEERYLFAQLFAAAPHVVLSWQHASDDGKERVASTLLDRVRRGGAVSEQRVPGLHAQARLHDGACLTELERVVLSGVAGREADHAALLPLALRAQASLGIPLGISGGGEGGGAEREVEALAAARLAVVRELAKPPGAASLGPYYGFLGPVTESADLRIAKRYVTSLERMAKCGWQAFVEKLLRVEATPDPLETLPQIDPRIVGSVVHDALERVFGDEAAAQRPTLADVAARGAAEARSWPDDAALESIALRCAREALDQAGPRLAGLAQVLATLALGHLRRARELDAAQGADLAVLDAEVEGELAIADDGGRTHEVAFKADRVELHAGRLVLTDFKTSRKPLSTSGSLQRRVKAFAQEVARGRLLQAVAYARARGTGDDAGRYLFVNPEVDPQLAEFLFDPAGPDASGFVDAFEGAVRTLGRSWDAGVFPPRLTQAAKDEQPGVCKFCDVKDACIQGESGLRGRQRAWATGLPAAPGQGPESEALQLAGELWELDRAEIVLPSEAQKHAEKEEKEKKKRERAKKKTSAKKTGSAKKSTTTAAASARKPGKGRTPR